MQYMLYQSLPNFPIKRLLFCHLHDFSVYLIVFIDLAVTFSRMQWYINTHIQEQ